MEILKRSQGFQDGEIVSWNENKKAVEEEVLRRNAKAGYCTKYGESVQGTKIMSLCSFSFLPRKINGKIVGD